MTAVEGHSLVWYKSALYAYGGKNAREEYTNELWEIVLSGNGATMSKVETTGEKPPPRAYHASALWRDRYLLVMGGVGTDPAYDGAVVHVLDLEEKAWRQRSSIGDVPAPRCHHTITVSPAQDRLFLYGGYPVGKDSDQLMPPGSSGVNPEQRTFFEIHELDLSGSQLQWQRAECTEDFPPTLWGHSASIYHNNLIIFGGVDVVDNRESPLACVWHCVKKQWRWVEFTQVPSGRALHTATACFDGRIFCFGGFGQGNTVKFNDTWVFSMDSGVWTELSTGGDHPSPRSGHASVMLNDQLLVFGGMDTSHRRMGDVHILHLPTARWSDVPVHVNPMRALPSPEHPKASIPHTQFNLSKAESLLTRADAQRYQYEAVHQQYFAPNPAESPTRSLGYPTLNFAAESPHPQAPLTLMQPPPASHPAYPYSGIHAPGPPSRSIERANRDTSHPPPPPPIALSSVGPIGPPAPAGPRHDYLNNLPASNSQHQLALIGNPNSHFSAHPEHSFPSAHPSRSPFSAILPYGDQQPETEARATSPARRTAFGVQPPPPQDRSVDLAAYGVVPLSNAQLDYPSADPTSGPQATQGVQTDNRTVVLPHYRGSSPLHHSEPASGALQEEAATIIQKQRQEIDMLRNLLEKRNEPMHGRVGLREDGMEMAVVPQGPSIKLTTETITDMMPTMNLNMIDTPVLRQDGNQARPGESKPMSRDALLDLIRRRIPGGARSNPLQHTASPLLYPGLLSTAPTDTSRHTVQRRDIGRSGLAGTTILQEPLSPPKARSGDATDIVQY
eukprot:gene728-1109_t